MTGFCYLMVGLTQSERDIDLIRYAALLACMEIVVDVLFVHVLPNRDGETELAEHDLALKAIEQQVAGSFLNIPDSVEFRCEVLHGPRVDRLLSFAAERQVDLVLVGHRPDHPPGRGSLVRRLSMKAPCSVWIVPNGSPLRLKRLLVPIDFSTHSADAMLVALWLARRAGSAECLPLHVYQNEAVLTYDEYEPIARGEEQVAYQKFVAPIDTGGVIVTPHFAEGVNVAHAIHAVASENSVDLKVMSTRGRSRSAAILLGSVTEGVIIEARTPVLVIKHFGARLGLLQLLLDRTFRQGRSQHF